MGNAAAGLSLLGQRSSVILSTDPLSFFEHTLQQADSFFRVKRQRLEELASFGDVIAVAHGKRGACSSFLLPDCALGLTISSISKFVVHVSVVQT